ncbi:MAG: nucleotidyltransferase domain-containing protein [Armatimonadota bacterium]
MTDRNPRLAVAQELAHWLRRCYGDIVADVRLYGSVARGSDDALSDVDVLILVRRRLSRAEREQLSRRAYEADLEYGTVTQCLVRTVAEWERPEVQCGGLAREVAREGVPL